MTRRDAAYWYLLSFLAGIAVTLWAVVVANG